MEKRKSISTKEGLYYKKTINKCPNEKSFFKVC